MIHHGASRMGEGIWKKPGQNKRKWCKIYTVPQMLQRVDGAHPIRQAPVAPACNVGVPFGAGPDSEIAAHGVTARL